MAIIEEISSDDEQDTPLNKQPKKDQPLPTQSANVKLAAEETLVLGNAVHRLVSNKRQTLKEENVTALLESHGLSTTWEDVLTTTKALLHNHTCDTLDIDSLERLIRLVAILHKNTDVEQQASMVASSHGTLTGTLTSLCNTLKVPSVFMKEDYNITADDAQKQSFWLAGSTSILQLLQAFLTFDAILANIREDLEMERNLVIVVSKFAEHPSSPPASTKQAPKNYDDDEDELEPWVTPLSSQIVTSLLNTLLQETPDSNAKTAQRSRKLKLVKHILLSYIKPLFTSTPHPMLNPGTGRKLDRRRGGELFGDSYLDGEWKGRSVDAESAGAVGCWKVYIYLLALIDKDDFEEIWPLLVPPMMTLLDDHQIYFKHQGIRAVSAFLDRTPAVLLLRTGLNDLIQQSLTTAYSFTSEAQNVPMIRDAISTNLQLVNLLYPKASAFAPGSMSHSTFQHKSKRGDPPLLIRFNTLSSIYHNCIISIFTYASSSIPFMTLAFHTIPLLVAELGKGSIRFLGDTMAVLCSSMGGSPASRALASVFSKETLRMHVEAAGAMIALIEVCREVGRIERWRGMVLSSVATLWCNIKEQEHPGISTQELEDALKDVVRALTQVCGDVVVRDCKRMQALDPTLFSELFANAV